ncbi:RNA-binding S4 domain-containing protein [Aureimonas mangrovi]|uniref:RNA-binding S4 domain-containing protein n=1 Tax=Aureimonas mangrovi TaxID=2758041 RepID=UPI00163D3E35|nr:RNA-binding S4 domain-containing protein [Aureimonas mangrovi]
MSEARSGQRIDKWLFFARLLKTRSLAQKLVVSGAVRINREKVSSAARLVRPGDVLTLSVHERVRVLKVVAIGDRRGPAPEAQELYEDLSPVVPATPSVERLSAPVAEGRPDRRERREAAAFKRGGFDG